MRSLSPLLPPSLTPTTQFSLYPFSSPDFTSLAAVNRKYDGSGYIRYSQAKLSGILFSREFNKRFGKNVRSLSVHPGFVVRLSLKRSIASLRADSAFWFPPARRLRICTPLNL